MTEFVNDSFNGTVGDDIQVYNPAWARVAGITGTTTIGSRFSARGTGAFYRSDAPAPGADFTVTGEIYINSIVSGPSLAILADVSTTAVTYYQASLISGTGVRLSRTVNGSTLAIDTVPYSQASGNILKLKLQRKGQSLSVYVDDVLAIGPFDDSAIPTTGLVGFRIINASGNQLQLDGISGETSAGEATAITAGLTATLDGAMISGSALVSIAGDLSQSLAPVALASSAASPVKTRMAAALAPAVLDAAADVEAELPAKERIDAVLSASLAAATLSASASPVVTAALSSTLASPTLAATAKASGAPGLDISKINTSRVVAFEGSGSRVVIFEGSGSRVVVFGGSGKRVRFKQMSAKVPTKLGEKWTVDRDRDEISFHAADITDELIDRNTTVDLGGVDALVFGVELLEGPEIQVATIDGVERTFVVVKLGGIGGTPPDDWRWVARVPCVNGERFDKTTWFNEVDP